MASDSRLCIHHVGARGGDGPFPVLQEFEPDFIRVSYEADDQCISGIEKYNQRLASECLVFPYCLGSFCGKAVFNINRAPATSSLYEANPEFGSYYFFRWGDHDCILSEACATVEKREVEVVTLDSIVGDKLTGVPAPDFLSLDTQGAEYDVLLGATRALSRDILAVTVEVEFHELYKGQKLYGDVGGLLAKHGFVFSQFLMIGGYSPFRAKVGLRGKGFHSYADALFLKRIDSVMQETDEESRRSLMLQKLAFISILYDQIEYGLACLDPYECRPRSELAADEAGPLYLKFLRELQQDAKRIPDLFPPTMAANHPYETTRARLCNANDHSRNTRAQQAANDRDIAAWIDALKFWLQQDIRQGYSPVESLLSNYGLKKQASLLRQNRLYQVQQLAQLIENSRSGPEPVPST